MATIDKKLLEQAQAQQAQPVQQSAASAAVTTPAAVQTPAEKNHALSGVSQNAQDNLAKYTSGYTPSASVAQAQEYLNGIVSGKPGAYQSQYQNQLNDLYNQVMNRGDFTFNLNGNTLYNMYKDQYMTQGKQAMMDTMGQAAAMTGGYGNSYATTAGNQAYQGYLQKLNEIVPDLYQMELDRYNQAGEDMLKQYQMTADLENTAYGQYRDTVADWNTERDFANADYLTKYEQDYNNYASMLNYWNQLAQRENAAYFDQQQMDMAQTEMAYQQAMTILQAGKMPSNDLLAAAGISAADAKNLYNAWKKKSSGGSSSKKSTNPSPTPESTPEPENDPYALNKKAKEFGTIILNGALNELSERASRQGTLSTLLKNLKK